MDKPKEIWSIKKKSWRKPGKVWNKVIRMGIDKQGEKNGIKY